MISIEKMWTFAQSDWCSFIFGAISISAVIGFLPHLPQIGTYIVLVAFALFCFFKSHYSNPLLIALLIYIPIELLLTQPDPLFKSWSRYAMFALLLCCVSPLLNGEYHRMARMRMMQMLLWACSFIGIGSFFAWFLGINYMVASKLDFASHVGLFGGLTTHSMLLGPISGIGAIFMLYYAFAKGKKLCWLFVTFCLITVLFAASRSALMATLTGVIVTAYKLSGRSTKFVRVGFATLVLAVATFSTWEGALDGIISKNSGNTESLDTSSRQAKWDARISEFQKSPMIGIGFVSIDKGIVGDEVDYETGTIETGTSWLIIFSMLGIIGAVILLPFLYKSYITIWKQKDQYSAIVVGVLTLMYIHMFAEGYIFSAGSFMCFVLWLTLGIANDSKFLK